MALCPAYHYSVKGTGKCIPCTGGLNCQYPNATTNITLCQPGYYISTLDWACQVCPNGHYCPVGASVPIECPAGMYAG